MQDLTANDIMRLLGELNEQLKQRDIHGEMYIFGGAVMAVEYQARLSTRDIDAVFEPKNQMYQIAAELAEARGLSLDWLNDGVKGFVSKDGEHKVFASFSNLTVWSPSADYMLAMKCMSARAERDFEDIKTLMRSTGMVKGEDVFKAVEKYYPAERMKINTMYTVMAAEQEIQKEAISRDEDKDIVPEQPGRDR